MERRLAAILAADVAGYTRLMGADEAGTHARLKAHREELIGPKIADHGGRIFKLMGDGLLAEFASVVAAVECAVAIQEGMEARNESLGEAERLAFRIGINLGDVIVEESDVYGDGVNLAARLQALAEPGGICVSEDVYRQVQGKTSLAFEDLGRRELKNIAGRVQVYRLSPGGDAAEGRDGASARAGGSRGAPGGAERLSQDIRFCTTADGVRIAYATVGEGPPLVKAANWMNHLEYDWESPIWRHWVGELARDHQFVRYDERANGLSDWEVEELSFEALVSDLETVVDAVGLERFALLGISQGAAVSVAYAVRHPERVSRMVIYGGYAQGWRARSDPKEIAWREAAGTLIRQGWGQDNPAFRQVFTTLFIPEGTSEQIRWHNELQRKCTSPDNAARLHDAFSTIDVSGLLPQVSAPTLVLHCRDDAVAPFDQGRLFATSIPGARFVPLESPNHLILPDEPAWARFMTEVRAFLDETPARR